MKTSLLFGAAILTCSLSFSCSDNENSGTTTAPNAKVEKEFLSRYPNATNVEWISKKGYDVALFDLTTRSAAPTQKNEAWFTDNGKWCMTESDIDSDELPSEIAEGWKATTFISDGYQIDDVDVLERGGEAIYKIEIEKAGAPDYDLFFNTKGELLSFRIDQDDDDDNLPTPTEILEFLNEKYKNVQIIECEEDEENNKTIYEVEFIDENSWYNEKEKEFEGEKEATFTANYEWISTVTETIFEKLPEVIRNAFNDKHQGVLVEEVEIIETDKETKYIIETDDFDITLNEKGEEIK